MKKLIPSFEKATGKNGDSFIGVRAKDGKIVFKYPEAYNLCSNNNQTKRKQAMRIIASFCLTKKSNESDSFYSKAGSAYDIPLLSYLWLINDYMTYHQYQNREPVIAKGIKGKIDWSRTLRQQPMVQDMEPFYPNPTIRTKSQRDNIIVDIYRHCLITAINAIGWIYEISIDEYLLSWKTPFQKNRFLSVIKSEASKTFDDLKRLRLSHMLNVIEGENEQEISSNEFVRGVDQYEVCFEIMLRKMFSNVKSLKDFYPSAEWTLITDGLTKKSSNLRPDIVMLNEARKTVYILDAKYYRFGTTFDRGDLPDSSSVQKQITYGEYIKNLKLKGYSVFNAFIMPFNKESEEAKAMGLKNVIEYIGEAKAPWTDNSNEQALGKVVAVLIDLTYLIDNWSLYNEPLVEQLSNLIEQKAV